MFGRILLGSIAGLLAGSVLTALADDPDTWHRRRRSRCPHCGAALRVPDLLPLVSFVLLRGRCRSCRQPIPRWHLAAELAAVGIFVLAALVARDRSALDLVTLWALLALLLALAVIDLRHFLLPDALVGALAVVGAGRSLLLSQPGFEQSLLGGATGLLTLGALAMLPWSRLRARAPTAQGPGPMAPSGAMGFGDVKLAGAMGIALGLPGLLVALFLSFVAGGGVGAVLVLSGRAGLKSHIPFGPFLAGAAAVVLLFPALPSVFFRLLGFGVE